MRPAPIFIDPKLKHLKAFLQEKKYGRIALLVDSNTAQYCLPYVLQQVPDLKSCPYIEILAGEENKTINSCITIWNSLLKLKADRNSLLINLGGGVVTDIGGFAAATFKRGINFIHVPTSLLAQVDASIGGKTGVDLDQLKNIIGTFTQPQAVFICSGFLKTLNEQERIAGYAEAVKHALIANAHYFHILQQTTPQEITEDVIQQSINIKNKIVQADPFEDRGFRKMLNFGHTIGHAIESFSLLTNQKPLLHGEAIAIGMICEAFLSYRYHQLPQAELHKITQYLCRVFPNYPLDAAMYPTLIELMQHDKKNQSGKIGFALLNAIGSCEQAFYLSEKEIISGLDFYKEIVQKMA